MKNKMHSQNKECKYFIIGGEKMDKNNNVDNKENLGHGIKGDTNSDNNLKNDNKNANINESSK